MAQYAVEADVLIKNPFFLHFLVSHPFGLSSELREQPYMQQDELGKYALQPELQIRLQWRGKFFDGRELLIGG